jgi:hypothetical protein
MSHTETLMAIADKRGYSGNIATESRREVVALSKSEEVTLDGHKAVISGTNLDFAQVSTLPTNGKGPHYTVEFAWQSAARIILNGGVFKS